ncbi:MAG: peptidase [Patescibacteria group bacterium]|nr:peptidase [Patescibacteria group bacterium]
MLKKTLTILLIAAFASSAFFMLPFSASADCLSLDLNGRSDAELRAFLAQCNAEAAQTQTELNAQKAKSSSLASDVALLDSLIKKAAQQITIKDQIIKQLGNQIGQKQKTIETLTEKLGRENDSLGQILRKKNEIDTMTLTEMLLSNTRISDFFLDADNFETVNKHLQESLNLVQGTKQETSTEKANLETQKLEQANLRNQIVTQKNQTKAQQDAKNELLASSKSQEKSYAQILAQKQAQASKISAALFKFAGGSKAIPFGDAYRFAKVASAKTGVSPAFILAILKQESNLGTDQGGCYVTNLSTGTGSRAKNGEVIATVMKAPRDTVPYQKILSALGLTIANTQVSCPVKYSGSYSGYGGAMGPTQFIPSTWIGVADRVAAALGESAANPWDPQDAVMATAIFTKDLGAAAGGDAAEKSAACKYYSGRACGAVTGSSSYGASVMKIKASIQADMAIIDAAGG